MTRTSFEFSMDVSGDRGLLDAVRDVAAHVATYAGGTSVAAAVADAVVTAAEGAIATRRAGDGPVACRFERTPEALDVFISCMGGPAASGEPASCGPGLSVAWTHVNGRQQCHIRQVLA